MLLVDFVVVASMLQYVYTYKLNLFYFEYPENKYLVDSIIVVDYEKKNAMKIYQINSYLKINITANEINLIFKEAGINIYLCIFGSIR